MNLFAMADPRPIHFMGIAGAGMSGLALLARQQGVAITGCDTDPSGAADLAALGVEIWRGEAPPPVGGGSAAPGAPPGAGGDPQPGGGGGPRGALGAGGGPPPCRRAAGRG